MDSFNLADQVIARQDAGHTRRSFSVEDAPDIILMKHPSIYLHGGRLYHEHREIRVRDTVYLFLLIDEPDAKLTQSQSVWVFNRLKERAAILDERFIVVNRDMAWDKVASRLVPIGDAVTMSDKTTRRLRDRR